MENGRFVFLNPLGGLREMYQFVLGSLDVVDFVLVCRLQSYGKSECDRPRGGYFTRL